MDSKPRFQLRIGDRQKDVPKKLHRRVTLMLEMYYGLYLTEGNKKRERPFKVSTQLLVKPSHFDEKKQKILPNEYIDAEVANQKIERMKEVILEVYNKLLLTYEIIDRETLRKQVKPLLVKENLINWNNNESVDAKTRAKKERLSELKNITKTLEDQTCKILEKVETMTPDSIAQTIQEQHKEVMKRLEIFDPSTLLKLLEMQKSQMETLSGQISSLSDTLGAKDATMEAVLSGLKNVEEKMGKLLAFRYAVRNGTKDMGDTLAAHLEEIKAVHRDTEAISSMILEQALNGNEPKVEGPKLLFASEFKRITDEALEIDEAYSISLTIDPTPEAEGEYFVMILENTDSDAFFMYRGNTPQACLQQCEEYLDKVRKHIKK